MSNVAKQVAPPEPSQPAVLATDATATHFVLLRPGLSTCVKEAAYFKRQRNAEALAAKTSDWHLAWIPVCAASIEDAAKYQPAEPSLEEVIAAVRAKWDDAIDRGFFGNPHIADRWWVEWDNGRSGVFETSEAAWRDAYARLEAVEPRLECVNCHHPIRWADGSGWIHTGFLPDLIPCSNAKPEAVEGEAKPPWLQHPCPTCGAVADELCESGASCMSRVLITAKPQTYCHDEHDGWECSLPLGHTGNHEAHWEDGDYSSAPLFTWTPVATPTAPPEVVELPPLLRTSEVISANEDWCAENGKRTDDDVPVWYLVCREYQLRTEISAHTQTKAALAEAKSLLAQWQEMYGDLNKIAAIEGSK